MSPDPELRRFAGYVAGPRDFVINFVINGVIAWFVFGRSEAVPLAGPDSIFNMLLPMSAIEGTLTSFFGLINGIQNVLKRTASNSSLKRRGWVSFALVYSAIRGTVGFLFFLVAMFAIRSFCPAATLPTGLVPVIVGLISGALAYVLHSRAVIDSVSVLGTARV